MKLVRIFANNDSLWSVSLRVIGENGLAENTDELDHLFDNWNNVEFLEDFFESNKHDLKKFYGDIKVEEAVEITLLEARRLEATLINLAKSKEKDVNLDAIFKPLDNQIYIEQELTKSKAKGNARKSWLRIYAIRIDKNCFVVTGGAIKLTHLMKDREHTNLELIKINRCRDFLKAEGLDNIDAFFEL